MIKVGISFLSCTSHISSAQWLQMASVSNSAVEDVLSPCERGERKEGSVGLNAMHSLENGVRVGVHGGPLETASLYFVTWVIGPRLLICTVVLYWR